MKAVFLDRDGVINELVYYPEHGVIDSPFTPSQFKLMPNAAKAINKLRNMGYKIIVASNQPGIAKGHMSEEAFDNIRQKMKDELAKEDAYIDEELYCFHHLEASVEKFKADCPCRKPKPGLLIKASEEMGIDMRRSWMIGDGITDIQAGGDAGVRTILLGRAKCELCHMMSKNGHWPNAICANLMEAAEKIMAEESPRKTEVPVKTENKTEALRSSNLPSAENS